MGQNEKARQNQHLSFFLPFKWERREEESLIGLSLFKRLPFVVVLNQCSAWLASLEFILLIYNKRGDHVHVIAYPEPRVNTELVSIDIFFSENSVNWKLDANNYFLTFGGHLYIIIIIGLFFF